MPNTSIGEMLRSWEKQRIEYHPKIVEQIPISEEDVIKISALSEIFKLSKEEVIGNLLSSALCEVEAKMAYIPGSKVIRTEEGYPVYEDVGKTPSYLEVKARIKKASANSLKKKTIKT